MHLADFLSLQRKIFRLMHLAFGMLFQKWHGIRQKLTAKFIWSQNYSNEFGQDVLAVRGDLMEEYGIDEIKDWDSLMAFFKACAENGMYASQGGPWYQYFQERDFYFGRCSKGW